MRVTSTWFTIDFLKMQDGSMEVRYKVHINIVPFNQSINHGSAEKKESAKRGSFSSSELVPWKSVRDSGSWKGCTMYIWCTFYLWLNIYCILWYIMYCTLWYMFIVARMRVGLCWNDDKVFWLPFQSQLAKTRHVRYVTSQWRLKPFTKIFSFLQSCCSCVCFNQTVASSKS